MFSAWDFHGWLGSLLIVLYMGGIIVGFSTFVAILLKMMLGDTATVAEASPTRHDEQKREVREAA